MAPVVIDTADVPVEQRFAYWRRASLQLPLPLQVEGGDRGDFHGRRASYDLGDVRVSRTASDESLLARTRPAVVRVDPDAFMVSLHLGGIHAVSQDGRTGVCGSGDIVVCDSARPLVVRSQGSPDVVTYFVPKHAIGRGVDALSAQTATRVDGAHGRARLARVFLRELIDALERGDIGPDDEEVAGVLVDLIRSLFTAAPQPDRDLLAVIKRAVEARLGDPELGPDVIAREHHVSRRHLYRLFETDGVGVADWIRSRRLECCARDLRDPALAEESITAIAMRWGFVNPSHFSRTFRDAFGVPPREYRRG